MEAHIFLKEVHLLILVIAEKPSVAQSIAKVLGATSRKDGYLEGNNYIVSWCVGHLVGLADASSYNERYAKWRYDDLPIVPEEWLFEVPKDKAQQFKILRDLIKDKRVTELVCATDAGREGELIFRLVYHKAGCTKPFKRLWISSLEDAAIREGFNHLRDGSDYDKLYEAALSRSKADWIVGINGTRLFTTLYKKKLVVGRVQTPTLAMLVEREGKITTFHKEKYFNVHVERDGLIADMEKIKTEEEAKTIAAACDKKQAVVSSVRKETKTVNPPKLYDLTTLQREANRYFSFTAQQTLDLVQSLYEKKLLTYPRTDSQFITDDMEGTARKVIDIICRKVSIFDGIRHDPDMKRIINNAKVTDHHAIIPTVQLEKQDISELPQSEQKVLSLVGMRLLAATGEKHIYDETRITLSCEGYEFKSKGKTVTQEGWKAVEQRFKASLKTKDKEDPEKVLPAVNENDILSPVSASVTEHYTTPPKPYTEDTLLSAMETAGNDEFDEETEKKGLGTPATRAGIIEKLVKSGFIERKGKSLVPTKDGSNLVCVLPEQITSPTMTAEWENTLMQIERGNADADVFLKGIVQMTGDLVKAYPFLSDAEANRFESGKEVVGKCPRCGSPVYVGKGNYYCSSKECSFCMWEDNKFFASKKKKLTKKIAKELLDKGWCRVKGLYTPKKPQLYDAIIKLDDTGGNYVSFKMEFEK
jgi:DNA topoisomerase-3